MQCPAFIIFWAKKWAPLNPPRYIGPSFLLHNTVISAILKIIDGQNCETQPPASIGWVALSSVVRRSFVVRPASVREAPRKKIPKAFGHCPFGGGGLNPCPDGLGQLFWEEFAWFWGGLDPCPDGLGHFFPRWTAPECPFECGGGVQSLKGQCPNAFGNFFVGASLTAEKWPKVATGQAQGSSM